MAEREENAHAALRVLEQANLRIAGGLGERCIRALLDAGLVDSKIGTAIPVSELLRFAEALLAQTSDGVKGGANG
jgi:hypothetical protein